MAPVTVLNVAEKPSVARALAGVFSRMPGSQDQPMQRQAAQIFHCNNVNFPSVYSQGEGRLIHGPMQAHIMVTTSVRGHLASQDFGPRYGWSNCSPVALFDAPIETLYRDDMVPLERMLKDLARRAQVLILWLDCDREGEAIGDEVREVCCGSNTRLQVYRARFSTVMPQEIQRALKSLGRLNQAFVDAVQARSQLDLRVGAAFTRFQTLRLQKKFDSLAGGSVISYGPCQFPTLGFVVERWARIETFVPEDYWYLQLTLSIPQQQQQQQDQPPSGGEPAPNNSNMQRGNAQARSVHFSWKRNRLYDRVVTMVLYESCLEAGQAVVTDMSGRPKNKWRPVPLATVELQKRASRFLRIGAETLMSAAEELYQNGYISYPRTETEKFRPEFQHRPLIQDFTGVGGNIGAYASKLLTNNNFQMPRAGQHDDNAHPPITPCKAVDPASIPDATQRNVYLLVVKHYLACCSRDAVGKETTLCVRIASEEFTARGLMILEKNWLEVYEPWERWSTGQGELPRLEIGSRLTPSSLLMKEGRTAPPQPISEVELISLMDRNGIGTDATIAQHIATIQERSYAIKDAQQKFLPTKLGIALVEGYNSMGYKLNLPDLRRETEHECNLVASGQKSKEDIMAPILNKMKDCFIKANDEAHKLDDAVARHFPRLGTNNDLSEVLQPHFSLCGTCQNPMALKQTRPNNHQGNNRNGQTRKILFCETCQVGLGLPMRGQFQPMNEADHGGSPVLCPICQYQVVKVARGDGYTGNGYNLCPKCFSEPPREHGGLSGSSDFRCFNCHHPTCALATGTPGSDVEVYSCPFCGQGRPNGGKVCLRKNSRGFVLSCSNYSGPDRCQYTVWLPKAASTISVPTSDNEVCRHCSTPGRTVRRVHFTWRSGSVPPHFGRESTICVLCDSGFRQDLNVRLPQLNQVMTTNRRRTANSARASGSGGRQNQGGNTCYRCGQPGHFANNCPRSQ